VKKSAECSVQHPNGDALIYLFLCPYCVSWRQYWPKLHFFAEKFHPCTQFEYNSHGYTYTIHPLCLCNIQYNAQYFLCNKKCQFGYYGQPSRPTPAARQQTSPSWLSVSPHNDHNLYPVLWQKGKGKGYPYSIPSVGIRSWSRCTGSQPAATATAMVLWQTDHITILWSVCHITW